MKKIIIGFVLVFLIVLTGCQPTQVTCNKPYIKVGTKCCLDVNDNNICDKDEEEKSIKETISEQKENAENIAKLFLVHWERKEYGDMHDLMAGSLKGLKSKKAFVWLMEQEIFNYYIDSLRYDGIVMKDSNTAYVQYTVSSGAFEFKYPSIVMELIGGTWKVDAFGDLFSSTCGNNKCQITETFEKHVKELYCPLDCFGEIFRMYLNDYEQIFFLGKVYDIELLKIDAYNTTIKVQNIEVTLGYQEEFNIMDNIFIKQNYVNPVVDDKESATFTIFNRD